MEGLISIVDSLNKNSIRNKQCISVCPDGELKDLIPPVTNVVISGEKGKEGWYDRM